MRVRVHKKCHGVITPIAYAGYFWDSKKSRMEPVHKHCVKCMQCGHSIMKNETKLMEKDLTKEELRYVT